ncbi:MAG: histone deacetylase [Cytophagaceae bacterium]|nr:histone deacetylase [Cytophagaceae bacterium]
MIKIAYTSIYQHPLPDGPNGAPHRFPMAKYELIPQQLLYEGSAKPENFFAPAEIEERWILNTHTAGYWEDLKNLRISAKMVRKIGFPLSERLVRREKIITQGTIDCCHFAMETGVALNVAGGTHHAFPDRGEGFCLLNDVGIASNYLLENGLAKKILIIDLDVHQGNGTAVIFRAEPRVFTFSMHGRENYPLHKEQSDLDIELPTGCADEVYLGKLHATLPQLLSAQRPDFLFFIAGVDVLESDKLGKLSVTRSGCRQRDQFVFEQARQRSLPIVVTMGGGYSTRLADIVEAHCNTFRVAEQLWG